MREDYIFRFPDKSPYENISKPVEIRIYGFSGQYGGHKISLKAFKLFGEIV